mmetsp:Transcript_73473/g.192690  ORF Transcript_73473/g.192690 Transcript_73473/m.192690 type:complete len:235 (+) Transcript_73473:1490-2194(+)
MLPPHHGHGLEARDVPRDRVVQPNLLGLYKAHEAHRSDRLGHREAPEERGGPHRRSSLHIGAAHEVQIGDAVAGDDALGDPWKDSQRLLPAVSPPMLLHHARVQPDLVRLAGEQPQRVARQQRLLNVRSVLDRVAHLLGRRGITVGLRQLPAGRRGRRCVGPGEPPRPGRARGRARGGGSGLRQASGSRGQRHGGAAASGQPSARTRGMTTLRERAVGFSDCLIAARCLEPAPA